MLGTEGGGPAGGVSIFGMPLIRERRRPKDDDRPKSLGGETNDDTDDDSDARCEFCSTFPKAPFAVPTESTGE